MRYVTVQMIADHVGRDYETVRRRIKELNLKGVERFGGSIGIRIPERIANDVIRRIWLKPALPAEELSTGQPVSPRTESVS
jgi:hypothetical protein